jgi:hypothetical protein
VRFIEPPSRRRRVRFLLPLFSKKHLAAVRGGRRRAGVSRHYGDRHTFVLVAHVTNRSSVIARRVFRVDTSEHGVRRRAGHGVADHLRRHGRDAALFIFHVRVVHLAFARHRGAFQVRLGDAVRANGGWPRRNLIRPRAGRAAIRVLAEVPLVQQQAVHALVEILIRERLVLGHKLVVVVTHASPARLVFRVVKLETRGRLEVAVAVVVPGLALGGHRRRGGALVGAEARRSHRHSGASEGKAEGRPTGARQ